MGPDPRQQEVTFKPVQWSIEAGIALKGATGNDPTYTLDDLKREVTTGPATLYSVMLGRDQLGFVVLWIDDFGGTKELVVQSGVAIAHSDFAIKTTLPALEQFARVRGALSIRAHSNDSSMIRHLRRAGWHKAEIVLRKAFS